MKNFTRRRRGSRASVLVAALVLLVVVLITTGALLQRVVRSVRTARQQAWQLQATWLAESALDRAVARQARDPEYRGEEWQPVVSGNDNAVDRGRVKIELQPQPPDELQPITVTAIFPDHSVQRAQVKLTRSLRRN